MLQDVYEIDNCPASVESRTHLGLSDSTSPIAEKGLKVSFENLLQLTNNVELHVRVDLGPWDSAELEDLGVSACQFDGDFMELLESRAAPDSSIRTSP